MRTTVVAAPQRELPPNVGTKYQAIERIGASPLYEVYRGHLLGAEGFQRPVLLKRMREACARNHRFVELFAREAKVASLLQHPNLVSALDLDRDAAGQLCIVLEHLSGKTLAELLAMGPLPAAAAARVVVEVLHGLAFMHAAPGSDARARRIHGELSPHCVLVQWDGSIKVTDFVLLASPHSDSTSETDAHLAYASPEKVAGLSVDGRADLYSVGMMLHELVTGRPPNLGRTAHAGSRHRLAADLAAPTRAPRTVPPHLRAVLSGMLKANRDARYPDCDTAAADLAARAAAVETRGAAAAEQELIQVLANRFPSECAPPPRRAPAVRASKTEPTQVSAAHAPVPAVRRTTLLPVSVPPTAAPRRHPWRWLVVVALVAAVSGALAGTWALAQPLGVGLVPADMSVSARPPDGSRGARAP